MSKRQANKLRDSDIVGLKYFDRLMPLLERLHDVGAQRDRAGNRQLFFDHYCAYVLLFLFNPVVTSLRGIQQASGLKKVQKKLGCPRASLGSLSEAVEVFDPEPVKQIAGELAAQLEPLGDDRSFPEVKHLVTAVDGTAVKTLARIVQAWASINTTAQVNLSLPQVQCPPTFGREPHDQGSGPGRRSGIHGFFAALRAVF
jgi:hypothetical protein